MDTLRRLWECILGVFVNVCFILAAVGSLGLVGKIFYPLWPVATFLFVVVGTLLGFRAPKAALLSVAGIMVYIAAWPAMKEYGPWAAAGYCCVGFTCWCVAAAGPAYLLSIFRETPEHRVVSAV